MTPQTRFTTELRVCLRPAAALVMLVSLVVVWLTGPHPVLMPLAVAAALTILIDMWQPLLARWLLVLLLSAAVLMARNTLATDALLPLLAAPVALAGALLSIPAAAGTAAIVSALLLAAPVTGAAYVLFPIFGMHSVVTLIAVWAITGVIFLIYQPVARFAGWAAGYYADAQAQLADAVERKIKYEQMVEDLTHVSRQLAISNERLVALRRIAEEAQQTKANVVAKVSHEFRTPLNMIIGLVDLMVKAPEVYGRPLPRAAVEDLAIVQRNCEHLAGLINDVLDLSQVEAGRLTLHRERTDLAAISREALDVVGPWLRKKGLDLQVEIPPDLPEVYCDRTRIRQVILNLLSNAVRFTEQGQISLVMRVRPESVVVTVHDTGAGIPPEDIERIFEPFCQGRQQLWRDRGGTGLGLTISKQFVELHGGRIWLESEVGVGTSFHFELPTSAELDPAVRPTRWLNDDWMWRERRRLADLPDLAAVPRVLVCDESGALQAELGRLRDMVELVGTRDLPEAAQVVQSGAVHAGIVNAASADELLPALQAARGALGAVPLLGCVMPLAVPRAARYHALDYLIKPITRADLQRTLTRAGIVSAEEGPPEAAGARGPVLLVDDDPDVLMLWTRMLGLIVPEVRSVTAADGRSALAALREHQPALVLLDIMLPDISGWDVLAAKAGAPDIADIPVVLVTAQDPVEEPQRSDVVALAAETGFGAARLVRCALALSQITLEGE